MKKRYPYFTDSHSRPNNDAVLDSYFASAPKDPSISFPGYNPLKAKAGPNHTSPVVTQQINLSLNPVFAWLKAKAGWTHYHSRNLFEGSGVDIPDGLATCLPGSTFPMAKAGQNSKFLGNVQYATF